MALIQAKQGSKSCRVNNDLDKINGIKLAVSPLAPTLLNPALSLLKLWGKAAG
jgi:hypothetical protein